MKKSNDFGDELKKIYEDGGRQKNLHKLDHKKRGKTRAVLAVFFLLALITAASWLGLSVFNKPSGFSGEKIEIAINGPFSVPAGETAEWTIEVRNHEAVSLKNNFLNLRLPSSFIYTESSETAQKTLGSFSSLSQNYSFEKPLILAGQTWQIKVKGQIIGAVGDKIAIGAKLKYSPENYSSTFEKAQTYNSDITDGILAITALYPAQISSEETTSLDLTIKNISTTTPLNGLKLSLEKLPELTLGAIQTNLNTESEGSEEQFSKPSDEAQKIFSENGLFEIGGLQPQQSVKLKIDLTFKVEANAKFSPLLSILSEDVAGNDVSLAQETLEYQIIKGELFVQLLANGQETAKTLGFGEKINYLLSVKNKSGSALGDATLRLVIDSPVINWAQSEIPNKGTYKDGLIYWTKSEVPQFDLILPEDEIVFNLVLKTKSYDEVKNINEKDLRVAAFAEAEINKIDTLETSKTFESNTIINTFNSNVTLASKARYFDETGGTVGSGPLPPQVGQKTTYELTWDINNTFHELENLKLEAELPSFVAWEYDTFAEAGNIIFDNNRVIWTINRMPLSVDQLSARFKVSITPKDSDLNKIISLLNESKFTASDKETQGQITLSSAQLTTNLDGDKNASGKGLVQP
jgi:hypothetical protein